MAVTKPNAGISFSDLSHVYDGSPHGATVTTDPAGLAVDTTYNGSASLPVAIGSYAVTSTVNDAIFAGTATATFTITRMVQTVDFPDPGPQWTTNRVGLAATASSGLPVVFSVAAGPGSIGGGTNLTFTGAGTVSVVATQAGDADWLPSAATNAIAVTKAGATVTLGSLNQTYDGTAKRDGDDGAGGADGGLHLRRFRHGADGGRELCGDGHGQRGDVSGNGRRYARDRERRGVGCARQPRAGVRRDGEARDGDDGSGGAGGRFHLRRRNQLDRSRWGSMP
jgi:hypothetical protein